MVDTSVGETSEIALSMYAVSPISLLREIMRPRTPAARPIFLNVRPSCAADAGSCKVGMAIVKVEVLNPKSAEL